MDFLQKFQTAINEQALFTKKDKLILAVSGGVDSIVLADLCFKAGYQFIIAHCNFQLRGAESDADEAFVRALAEQYQVELKVQGFDTAQYAADQHLSIQEAARVLRYDWFDMLINEQLLAAQPAFLHPDQFSVLTAHHADDNHETLLMHFFRGTGLHGLTGIPKQYGQIKRPLLSFRKQDLLAYAEQHQLKYREDSSNESSKYTRNFFRNEIIPALRQVYPQVSENLSNNIHRFQEIEKLYKLSTQMLIQKICRVKGNEIHIPVKQLMQYKSKALIYEIIHPFGFSEKQVDEVIKLSASESGKYMDAAALHFRIVKNRHWLIITPVIAASSTTIVLEADQKELTFEGGIITVKQMVAGNWSIPTSPNIALLEASKIQFPLILRQWKTGDYFYPLGMSKKKKIARFLIDQKLSKVDKEKIWVLESNMKIIWVLGLRIDDRFKVTSNTSKAIQLSLIPV